MRTSSHGSNREKNNHGIIFLDLLIAIFIITTALFMLFKGISAAAGIARKVNERVTIIISVRNQHAEDKVFIFVNKKNKQ